MIFISTMEGTVTVVSERRIVIPVDTQTRSDQYCRDDQDWDHQWNFYCAR